MPWAKDFLVYDIESTGTDPRIFDLAQMGAVKMCRTCLRIYDSFVSMCRPLGPNVDPEAMAVHQIPLEQLEKAPPVGDMLTEWEKWMAPNPKLFMPVTWGSWDQMFMRGIYARISTKTQERRYPLTGRQLDAKSIAYAEIAKGKNTIPTGGLALISVKLGMGPFAQHDALQDAIREAEVLRYFMVPRKCKRKHDESVSGSDYQARYLAWYLAVKGYTADDDGIDV